MPLGCPGRVGRKGVQRLMLLKSQVISDYAKCSGSCESHLLCESDSIGKNWSDFTAVVQASFH